MLPCLAVACLAGGIHPSAAQNTTKAAFVCKINPQETLLHQSNRLMLEELALQPVSATQAGYHEHNGVSLDAQQIAKTAGTISYNVLCGISARVKRIYL